jgi:hypothetical protein
MRRRRVLFLAIPVLGLCHGLLWETHTVKRLDAGEAAVIKGPDFVAGAAVDDYLLKDGDLYGVASLSSEAASAKDCKT